MCFARKCQAPPHPSLDKLKMIINELTRAEVFEVKLFGGEFTFYPYWREVVQYLCERDFYQTFVSNGTLFDAESADYLVAHNILGGGISIHGTEAVHDLITQTPGSFRDATRGALTCIAAGLQISILYTLSRQNMNCIEDTIRCLLDMNILLAGGHFAIGRLCPFGQPPHIWETTRLSYNEFLAIFETIDRLSNCYPVTIVLGDAFPICRLPSKYHKYVTGCWQGTGFAHIESDGGVKACAILPKAIGNLLETPLTDIWDHELIEFRSLSWLPKKCGTCQTFCGGGCSASNPCSTVFGPDEFLVRSD